MGNPISYLVITAVYMTVCCFLCKTVAKQCSCRTPRCTYLVPDKILASELIAFILGIFPILTVRI